MSVDWGRLLKVAAGLFGAGLCVAGLWYLIDFVGRVDLIPHLAALDGPRLAGIAGLTICLTVAYVLIALSWRAILEDCGGQISAGRAQLVFSRANLGKYVPGNVLHMVGRQVLAMREGVPGWAVAKSLTVETALLVLTSAAFASALWLVSRVEGVAGLLSSLALFLAAAGGVLMLRRFGLPGCARAVLGYGVYHLTGGVVFALLFVVLGGGSTLEASFGFLVMAYVASWVLGLLTPGAPAGLGVREAVLIGLLQHAVPDQAVLGAAVLLSRGMSVVADLGYFLALQGWSVGSARANLSDK